MIKKFESFDEQYLKIEDMEDISIGFTDYDFNIDFLDKGISNKGMYYVKLRKDYSEEYFGYIDKGKLYGNDNLDKIKKELDLAFELIINTKQRLNKMNYKIAHELEFNFSSGSYIDIYCHIQHSKYDTEY